MSEVAPLPEEALALYRSLLNRDDLTQSFVLTNLRNSLIPLALTYRDPDVRANDQMGLSQALPWPVRLVLCILFHLLPREVADWERREDGRVWIRCIETAELCKLFCIATKPEKDATLGKTFTRRATHHYSIQRFSDFKVEVDNNTKGGRNRLKYLDTTVVYLYHSLLQPDVPLPYTFLVFVGTAAFFLYFTIEYVPETKGLSVSLVTEQFKSISLPTQVFAALVQRLKKCTRQRKVVGGSERYYT
ncbi:hypothetical protein ACHAWO_001927 [Cyclotella atomus]|uniref:Uncharacterized protein n=1 Tax=Cyclotella atomus TaxID=382360 RepID=A0ABD3NJJ6_9STRA